MVFGHRRGAGADRQRQCQALLVGPEGLVHVQSELTLGGTGYANEYQVERLLREVLLNRLAPVSEQRILCFIAEKVLDLPMSY